MPRYCLLAGYGYYPEIKHVGGDEEIAGKVSMSEIDEFVRRYAMNFQPQNEQLRF